MTAYYNEIDPFAAQWLRNLIAGGHIAPGVVDERSIEDVTPDELHEFTQCHFFAGVGVWSYALRLAGWPDNRQVWTGSCPCQPFSSAGKGSGFNDERHLWPHFFHLIRECQPQHVFGEQVAAGNANEWFDLVQSDLEGVGYTFGLTPFPSAGIGAPHIRERAYWVADSVGKQYQKLLPGLVKSYCTPASRSPTKFTGFRSADGVAHTNNGGQHKGKTICPRGNAIFNGSSPNRMGNANIAGLEGLRRNDSSTGWKEQDRPVTKASISDGVANAESSRRRERLTKHSGLHLGDEEKRSTGRSAEYGCLVNIQHPLEVNGFWRDADWLLCRDGKWRPVEPQSFPLVDGVASRLGRVEPGVARMASRNRVGRLKGYGNAINAEAARAFIASYMEIEP